MARFTLHIVFAALIFASFGMIGSAMLQSAAAQDAGSEATNADAEAAAPEFDATLALADRVLGAEDAPVEMIEYSSLTCPHCASFHTDVLPKLKKEYIDTGKLKLVFRDFPFDQHAVRASMLARCVEPKIYFSFLDVLFRDQAKWARAKDPQEELIKYARLAGMSEERFQACMDSEELLNGVLNSRWEGTNQFEIQSTPTFILNGGEARVSGARGFEDFQKAIEELLPES